MPKIKLEKVFLTDTQEKLKEYIDWWEGYKKTNYIQLNKDMLFVQDLNSTIEN